MTAATFLKDMAIEDASFAGPFAYYSNMPMKVFAGNENPVPARFVIEALDRMQAGFAKKENLHGMHNAIGSQIPDVCTNIMNTCLAQDGTAKMDNVNEGVRNICHEKFKACCQNRDAILTN